LPTRRSSDLYVRIHSSLSQQVNQWTKLVIRKRQQHVPFQHHIGHSSAPPKFRMLKCTTFFRLMIGAEYIWEIHKMFEIMNALPRYDAILTTQLQFFYQQFK